MSHQSLRDDAPWTPELGSELMARLEDLRGKRPRGAAATGDERRGRAPVVESGDPAVLHIDVAKAVALAEAIAAAPDGVVVVPATKVAPLDAMEWQLLEAAKACAANDPKQPPRRELVAVALREVQREQAFRDDAESRCRLLEQQGRENRQLRHDQFVLFYELVRFIARTHGTEPSATAVLAYVRDRARDQVRATSNPAGTPSGVR